MPVTGQLQIAKESSQRGPRTHRLPDSAITGQEKGTQLAVNNILRHPQASGNASDVDDLGPGVLRLCARGGVCVRMTESVSVFISKAGLC